MSRPLGCLTFSGLAAALVVALAVFAAAAATGNGIFSPGQLSGVTHGGPLGGVSSHADLGGRCDACHPAVLSSDRMGDRCLACHTQVRQDIAAKEGLHGRLLAGVTNCRDCHTDHRGLTASITLADARVFPHEQTGFSLAAHTVVGQGSSLGCRDCHPGSPVSFAAPVCATCHQALDPPFMAQHQEAFGTDCRACHDGVETYGKAFSHATYPLVAGHAQVACLACHRGSPTLAALRATSIQCVDCHAAKDVHAGRLGTQCETCHATSGWAKTSIDHDRTGFPLVGKHVGVQCEACHVGQQWSGIGTTCRSCHAAADPHAGKFTGDCGACHTANGWSGATFDHATLAASSTCVTCHARPATHEGIAAAACASCHGTTAWKPATFTVPHTFPLNHGRAAGVCSACHPSTWASYSCAQCHSASSMASRHSRVAAFSQTTCATCHPTGRGG